MPIENQQTDVPCESSHLDSLAKTMEQVVDLQNNLQSEAFENFAQLNSRLQRIEDQVSRILDLIADDEPESIDNDWRAQKAKVLAQYGFEEPAPAQHNQTTPDATQPAETSTPNPASPSTEDAPQKVEMRDEEIEQLKTELRAKIRQAEVDLSIKQVKLEQQEARIEEKQAELEQIARQLDSKKHANEAEPTTGVLGRLKRHLNLIAKIRGKSETPEEKNDKFLDSIKNLKAGGKAKFEALTGGSEVGRAEEECPSSTECQPTPDPLPEVSGGDEISQLATPNPEPSTDPKSEAKSEAKSEHDQEQSTNNPTPDGDSSAWTPNADAEATAQHMLAESTSESIIAELNALQQDVKTIQECNPPQQPDSDDFTEAQHDSSGRNESNTDRFAEESEVEVSVSTDHAESRSLSEPNPESESRPGGSRTGNRKKRRKKRKRRR